MSLADIKKFVILALYMQIRQFHNMRLNYIITTKQSKQLRALSTSMIYKIDK